MAEEKVARESDPAGHPPPDEDAVAASADAAATSASAQSGFADDESSESGGEDFDDRGGRRKGGRFRLSKPRLILFGGGALGAFLVAAGVAYFLLSGGDETAEGGAAPDASMMSEDASPIPKVTMALPPKPDAPALPRRGFTPPTDSAMTPPSPQSTPPAGTVPSPPADGVATQMATVPATPGQAAPAGSLNAVAATAAAPGTGIVVPAVTPASYAAVPLQSANAPLPPAPDPALLEDAPGGPLPRIAGDGRQAWQVYARPFQKTTDDVVPVAVVISGLGLSDAATQAAIYRLPPEVTLSFSPYTQGLQTYVISAREAGHEVMIGLPMQPVDFPSSDPGPYTLETELEAAENIDRLKVVLSRGAGYVGVRNIMGSGFAASEAALRPVLEELRRRGLLYLDTGGAPDGRAPKIAAEIGLPFAASVTELDGTLSRAEIDQRLADLEAAARRSGRAGAVAVGGADPVTIDRIAAWSTGLGAKNLRLAPVSAIAIGPLPGRKAEAAAQR
jgi:hypothetical protein